MAGLNKHGANTRGLLEELIQQLLVRILGGCVNTNYVVSGDAAVQVINK